MTSTKIRTTAAALAGAFTLALAAAPAAPVANASPNDGRYQRSAEAKRQVKICQDYKILFESEYDSYSAATNDKDRAQHAKNANHAFDNAHAAGCGWTGA
jgi:hypothetical protein